MMRVMMGLIALNNIWYLILREWTEPNILVRRHPLQRILSSQLEVCRSQDDHRENHPDLGSLHWNPCQTGDENHHILEDCPHWAAAMMTLVVGALIVLKDQDRKMKMI